MKFKVGDIVRVARKHTSFDSGGEMECWIGKLMTVSSTLGGAAYRMEEDKGKWIWHEYCLEPVNDTIIIKRNGNTVTAIDKSTNKKGIARCNPSDTFDLYTGSRLALDRLFGMEYKRLENSQEAPFEAKEKETYYNGKVVCVDNKFEEALFTTGKIYEFIDGQLVCNNGSKFPALKKHSFKEWSDWSHAKWMEVKEEQKSKPTEKFYNGRVVCVDKNENHGLYTTGKIYEFVDGQMTCDNRSKFPSFKIHSFDEWQVFSSAKWLEIKE